MNARRLVRASMTRGSAARPGVTERNPLTSEAIMHTDAQVRKAGGRLSREDQRRIGDILLRVYDDVLRQGVPDRFKDLLEQFDQSKHGSEAEGGSTGQGEREEPNRLVGAKPFD